MKAALLKNYGGPENLQIEEVMEPKPCDEEVIVQIYSAALNHLDIWVRKGGRPVSLPHIPGSDGAGIVIDKGSKVSNVNIGDKVVINPGLNCGYCEHCQQGQQSRCITFGIIGLTRPGTFAQQIAVPYENVNPKPEHLSFNEAAGLTLTFLTAWHMLFGRANLKTGETVLIHGIGGGVATACLQLAKMEGAIAIITSSSDEKIEKAKKLGANFAINYRTNPDIPKAVKEITNGNGVDVVADSVGSATWPINLQVVKKGGRIVICGVTTGAACQTDLQAIYWNQLNIYGSTLGTHQELKQMLNAVTQNKLKPVIDSIEPLENIVKAQEKMEQSKQFGKIILSIYV